MVAVARFEGPAREAVHALKYEGRYAAASTLGRVMADAVRPLPVDLVVPASLHRSRRRERGYDQAALLARSLATAISIPYREALRRTRRTQQQVTLHRERRRANVAGSFTATADVTGRSVLLVDDVLTTGSTLEAAAEALRSAGTVEVHGVVFASAWEG